MSTPEPFVRLYFVSQSAFVRVQLLPSQQPVVSTASVVCAADGSWQWPDQFVFDLRTVDVLQCATKGKGTDTDEDGAFTGVPRLRVSLVADNLLDSVCAPGGRLGCTDALASAFVMRGVVIQRCLASE